MMFNISAARESWSQRRAYKVSLLYMDQQPHTHMSAVLTIISLGLVVPIQYSDTRGAQL